MSRGIDWRSAFAAPPGRWGHGVLLMVAGAPEGGILAFEKTETIRGTPRRIVNRSSWYIRPRFRNLAVRMMREVTADPDTIYTGVSPILRFRRSACALVTVMCREAPSCRGRCSTARASDTGSEIAPWVLMPLPNPEQARWMYDHDDRRHVALSIRRGTDVVPVLWLRA